MLGENVYTTYMCFSYTTFMPIPLLHQKAESRTFSLFKLHLLIVKM